MIKTTLTFITPFEELVLNKVINTNDASDLVFFSDEHSTSEKIADDAGLFSKVVIRIWDSFANAKEYEQRVADMYGEHVSITVEEV